MKISNITILNTDLTNNTAKISFTISEATENVNVYLKINDEEYVEIFLNKTNEVLEYTVNISRGVNNLLLKATDSTDEYISEPIQVLLKEEPFIENLKCSYSDSTGKYILNFTFNGDTNFKYNIYLKLDANDYIEVLSNQISGDKTIEQTSTMGNHTCILKVSDGYDDYTFSSFQFEITNHKPILSKVLVTDITNNGEAYIYYATKDIESSTLTHKLTIGTTETVISPTQVDNFYSYKITGLSEGISNCTISISDGIDVISSDIFSIEVFSDTTDKKELLRRAKVRYDSAYQQLRDIIVSVVSDLKYDYDIENALIAKAQDNYKIEYSNFNKISQQSIDAIGNNKVTVTKKELQSEIKDVDNAVNSLETTMWGVFQDGILDQSERDTLSGSLDLVAKEKIDIDKDYEALYNNEDLTDPSKTKLQTNYNNFINAHNSLATTINNIINKEGIIDNTDKTNIDTAFENWRTALGNYRVASLEAIDAIAKKKADDSADVVDKKWAEIVLDPETGIKSQVGSLQSKITGAGGIEERLKTAEQTITTDGISNIVKDVYYTKTEVDNKVTNVDNKIKTTVKSVNVMYYLSTSTTELSGGTWTDVAPTWEANKYMWSKTVTTLSDGTIKESSPTCIAGAKGQDGVPGTNGKTTYTWIKYADDENGNGISNNPTNKSYIGFAYNKTTNIESNSPSDYTWSLIKGADGVDGQDGKDGTSVTILGSYNSVGELNQAHPNNNNNGDGYIVNGDLYIWDGKSFINVGQIKGEDGKNGADGQDGKNGLNAYVHIKYSNDGGKTFTPSNGEEVGDYLGIYTDYYEADSTDVTKYTWSKIKGQDGVAGTNGKDGKTYYTWIKYSNNADGTGLYDTPNSQTKYIGIATNKTTATESTNKTDYTWSLFKGTDGISVTSIEEEYYLSTSKTEQSGGSWVVTPPTWLYGNYLWTRSKITYSDGVIEYTTPICDSSWEAIDEVKPCGRNYLLNTDFSRSDNLSKWRAWFSSENSFNIYQNFGYNLDKDSFIKGDYALKNRCNIADSITNNKLYSAFAPKDFILEKNTEYTLSFYMYKSTNCKKCYAQILPILDDGTLGKKCGNTNSITNYTGAFEYQTLTFTTNNESNKFTVRFYNYFNDTLTEGNSDVHIYHPMLVKGNRPMDWYPAPEDTQEQIDSNKVEIETTKKTVSEHTVNLESITSRVSTTETEITTINGNVTNIDQRINAAEEKITDSAIINTVSKTFYTKNEIDNIEIGGKNLILNTDYSVDGVLDGWTSWSYTILDIVTYGNFGKNLDIDSFIKGEKELRARTSIDECVANGASYGGFKPLDIILEKDTTYTLSVWMYLGGNAEKAQIRAYHVLDDGSVSNDTLIETKEISGYKGAFEKVIMTFTTSNLSNLVSIRFYNYFKSTLTTGTSDIHLYHLQLEKGNKTTDWKAASDDTKERINSISSNFTQTANSFEMRISNNESEISSLKLTDEQFGVKISQNINDIASLKLTNEQFGVKISQNINNIASLSVSLDNIESNIVSESGVKSIIRQSSNDIQIGFNGINDRININPTSLDFRATNNNRDMSLFGGQVCIYNNANDTFMSTMGSVLKTSNSNYKGVGFLLGKNANIFTIGRDATWTDVMTNRSPNPIHYVTFNFDANQANIDMVLNTNNINMQNNNLIGAAKIGCSELQTNNILNVSNSKVLSCGSTDITLYKTINANSNRMYNLDSLGTNKVQTNNWYNLSNSPLFTYNSSWGHIDLRLDMECNSYTLKNPVLSNATTSAVLASGYNIDVENDTNVLFACEDITVIDENGNVFYDINQAILLLYGKIHDLEKEIESLKNK